MAFTGAAKELQLKFGSRKSYARMEQEIYLDGLTDNEIEFIERRDSFYIASIGANGYPYIQHRGGPRGFLKVIDRKRIGFIDFKGNMQYISAGNIATNDNVSLILVDYPARARLKLYAKSRIIELQEDANLYKMLDLDGYAFNPERMMVFSIEAYDWNCSQHITPRFTLEEIQVAISEQTEQVRKLQAEIGRLEEVLNKVNSDCKH